MTETRDILCCPACKGRLYYIDYDNLVQPILGRMFKERCGVPVRWGDNWGIESMGCPACRRPVIPDNRRIMVHRPDNSMQWVDVPAAVPLQKVSNTSCDEAHETPQSQQDIVLCPKCGKGCKPQGIKTHIRYCKG